MTIWQVSTGQISWGTYHHSQIPNSIPSGAVLLVWQHSTNSPFEDLIRHSREERSLSWVIQFVFVIVFGENCNLWPGNYCFLCVDNNYAFLISSFTGCKQLTSNMACEAPQNLVRCVINEGTCFSQESSPPFHLGSHSSIRGSSIRARLRLQFSSGRRN